MAFKKNLLVNFNLAAGAEKRILPNLAVENYDRLHFHVSNGTISVKGLKIRILFGTPVGAKILLTDSTVWFEKGSTEMEFSYTVPTSSTGIAMSVPVVAPLLYDVILSNTGNCALVGLHVSVMAQTM